MHPSPTLVAKLQFLIVHANSQKEVARLAQVSDGTFINWLRGHGVRESKLRQVARHLGVSLAWLRDGVGDDQAELAAFRARLHPLPEGPGRLVREARERAGLSREALSERLFGGVAYIDLIERGTLRPSKWVIDELSRALPALPQGMLLLAWGYPVLRPLRAKGPLHPSLRQRP